MKELIKRRPSNPTLYLAEHLTNHFDDPQSDQESEVSVAKLYYDIKTEIELIYFIYLGYSGVIT